MSSSSSSSSSSYFILLADYSALKKGSLVKPLSSYTCIRDPEAFVKVRSLDDCGFDYSVLSKELCPISDRELLNRLLPMGRTARISFLQREDYPSVIRAKVGDHVSVKDDMGIIQFLGPLKDKGSGYYAGVEFFGDSLGNSDGSVCGISYFKAPPMSSTFVALNEIFLEEDARISINSNNVSEMVKKFEYNSDKVNNNPSHFRERNSNSPSYADFKKYQQSKRSRSYGKKMDMDQIVCGRATNEDSTVEMENVAQLNNNIIETDSIKRNNYSSENYKYHSDSLFNNLKCRSDGRFYDNSKFERMNNDSILSNTGFPNEYGTRIKHSKQKSYSKTSESRIKSTVQHVCTKTNIGGENHVNNVESKFSSDENILENAYDLEKDDTLESHASTFDSPLKSPSSSKLFPIAPPNFDIIGSVKEEHSFEVGSLVEVHIQGRPLYGVIKWIGSLSKKMVKQVGVELEQEILGAGNGTLGDKSLFSCPENRGVFVSFLQVTKDQRFIDTCQLAREALQSEGIINETLTSSNEFGDMECPPILGFVDCLQSEDLVKISGRNKGIQGWQNSCYLDATLFAMFTFTSVFDCLLYRPANENDIPEYLSVQKVLREEIVNPLRKNYFVRADKVMKLRKFLDSLSSVQGLISDEKDPEELLNSLLCQTLKATPFLELSSGQTAHTYQLFVERDLNRKTLPTVQELFEQSFHMSAIKLRKMPSVLILQMPRFGKQFKVYDRILPTQILDVTDIIEAGYERESLTFSPRQCIICGNLAVLECPPCYGRHGNGLDSTAFCSKCHRQSHIHRDRQNHVTKKLVESSEFSTSSVNSRLYMELFAVVCIETSHYVTFAKGGVGSPSPWCFFDSMADRKGEINGYNIPEVTIASDINRCLKEKETDSFEEFTENKSLLPEHIRRFLCDGYMYFYQSSEVMMYQ